MKTVFPFLLALLTAIALSSGARADTFLKEYEDLPLPVGLTELPGGMLFENPNGRIVEATAKGQVPPATIKAFYAESLPQLGWKRIGEDEYKRDNEVLRIEVVGKGPATMVRFSVVPQ